ncbi:MAG: hypothetical protein IJN90_00695 [Bacilli bacterium]|nr:hypothetical protein [Bacilli bacterium]
MKKEVKNKIEDIKKTKKKKSDKVVLAVLGSVVILLLIVTVIVRNSSYFNAKPYSYDYLKFFASNYSERDGYTNSLVNNDSECYIDYKSLITEKKDLLNYGSATKINNHDWVKQDFDNGVTWMSYYKNSFYIIQMYGKDVNTYKNECKNDFEKIKSTFSFIKSE